MTSASIDLVAIRERDVIGRDWLASQHSFDLPACEWLGIVTKEELIALCDRAHDYEFDINVPLAELREENDRLRAALKAVKVEIAEMVERIVSDLQERDSGL